MSRAARIVEPPVAIVDVYEQAPLQFSPALQVERCALPVADYSLRGATEILAIERKRLGELATCTGIDRDRFLTQIEGLRQYRHRALVIEGDLDGVLGRAYRSEIHPLSVLGTLIKFSSDWQIPVWFCGDAKNTSLVVERMLLRVAKQQRERAA